MAQTPAIQLEESWLEYLQPEFDKDYMKSLKAFLLQEKKAGKTVFPPGPEIFNAFQHTPIDQVKVVIIGQDPYHNFDQAHGLSFSVRKGIKVPPSLRNIYKEQERDLGIENGEHGDLTQWAVQGVLLLNSVLTVEAHQAASHQGKGWETFTDAVISQINEHCENVVFLCWGSYAQKKVRFIDQQKHLVLKSVHPSPLSAHRGFIGCGHFSEANYYLESHGIEPIDWTLY